jgi:hypothetical protein
VLKLDEKGILVKLAHVALYGTDDEGERLETQPN